MKRTRCGDAWTTAQGEQRTCEGRVDWLTTHVARCRECLTLWWWEPRAALGAGWRSADDPGAARRIAYELARAVGAARGVEATTRRLLSPAPAAGEHADRRR